jgi:hypothetical protein
MDSMPWAKTDWIAGDLRCENLVRVQRIVITGCAGILHDLGSRQIVADFFAIDVAHIEDHSVLKAWKRLLRLL